nr:MAG TPA: hypothetical protein [Caudoviricetes sp.]
MFLWVLPPKFLYVPYFAIRYGHNLQLPMIATRFQ